jgi:hypothetical protein
MQKKLQMKNKSKERKELTEDERLDREVIDEWANDFRKQMTYEDRLRDEGAALERERIANAIQSEKALFPKMEEMRQKAKVNKKDGKLVIKGIDIEKLVKELARMDFFDEYYKHQVVEWFNGNKPADFIQMDVSAALFVSVIADIMDERPKLIHNTKGFMSDYIRDSFMFKGFQVRKSSIEQIMRPTKSKGRVSCQTKTIPNIKDFKK